MSNCPGRAIKTTPVAAANFDDIEMIFLDAARHFFLSFTEPETQAWETGLSIAMHRLGPEVGSIFATQSLAIVQAMRFSRRSTFHFSNPRCPCCRDKLTEHERNLMDTLIAVRRGNMSGAHLTAMMLCEGHSTDKMIYLMRDFSERIGPRDEKSTKPQLTLVR